MADPYIAQIIPFGGNFAIRGWALCHGQLLPISQNSALFSLLGTTYGGDGRTTFGLPDLRGRVPIQPGQGPGLSNYLLGEKGGTQQVTLTVPEIPTHRHTATLHAESAAGTLPNPNGRMLGTTPIYADVIANTDRTMAPESVLVQDTGGGQPHTNIQPFLCINFEIALVGIFPSRS